MSAKRQLHLNVNVLASGRHNAAWRQQPHPRSVVEVESYQEIARIAERGTFDAIFFADHPALDPIAATRPWHSLDPTIALMAMAAVTGHVGLVGTASTTFDHPFHIARRFSSLDHLSKGRAAWNIVTTQHDLSAANFGLAHLPPHADRYQRAHEFVDVVVKLWDSWDDDALVADQKTGRYVDLGKVRTIDHEGDIFSVRGPLNVPRSPQGRPVLVQAGASEESRTLGARWADAIFTVQKTVEEAKVFYADLKAKAARFGRDPDQIAILPGLYTVVGSTEAEARARKRDMDQYLDFETERLNFAERLGADPDLLPLDRPLRADILDHVSPHISRGFIENTLREATRENLTLREILGRNSGGHRVLVGSPEQIADNMQLWLESGAADGFNLNMDALPSGFELFVEHVVPELRRRGIFRHEYTGTTLREHLGIDRPVKQSVPAPTAFARRPLAAASA